MDMMWIEIGGAVTVVIGGVALYFITRPKPGPLKDAVISEQAEQKVEHALEPSQFSEKLSPSEKLNTALSNTKSTLLGRIQNLFSSTSEIPWDEIEEVLYTSDLGPQTVQTLMQSCEGATDLSGVKSSIKTEMQAILSKANGQHNERSSLLGLDQEMSATKPIVWMVVGVNGSGKTTTIGKLAHLLSEKGKKVMLAAGDTFRAAADAQLRVWSERANVELHSPENVTDPSAVAYEACSKAVAKGFDHVIVDTAGRLHTQKNLMEELRKMKRVVEKAIPGAPHEILLILDANNGQNALIQAREFHQALGLTGVIFTKMDGSAKAGVAIGLANELLIPIKRIGIGESIEDLRLFNSQDFVDSII